MNIIRNSIIVLLSFIFVGQVLANNTEKKDLYIQKLSSCDSVGLEKRYFPKEKSSAYYNNDSMSVFYGCVGNDPDTYFFVKDSTIAGAEGKFNDEVKLFSDLVDYYKKNSGYKLAGSSNREIKTGIIEKYRFDKKQ
ncbi:MAG: hypothetical protein R2877_04810 [Bdellovibrionota bacterium]